MSCSIQFLGFRTRFPVSDVCFTFSDIGNYIQSFITKLSVIEKTSEHNLQMTYVSLQIYKTNLCCLLHSVFSFIFNIFRPSVHCQCIRYPSCMCLFIGTYEERFTSKTFCSLVYRTSCPSSLPQMLELLISLPRIICLVFTPLLLIIISCPSHNELLLCEHCICKSVRLCVLFVNLFGFQTVGGVHSAS